MDSVGARSMGVIAGCRRVAPHREVLVRALEQGPGSRTNALGGAVHSTAATEPPLRRHSTLSEYILPEAHRRGTRTNNLPEHRNAKDYRRRGAVTP
jgi:hypothetical protein